MKDGVNSANRYYLNRFRDAYRQAVIGKEGLVIPAQKNMSGPKTVPP